MRKEVKREMGKLLTIMFPDEYLEEAESVDYFLSSLKFISTECKNEKSLLYEAFKGFVISEYQSMHFIDKLRHDEKWERLDRKITLSELAEAFQVKEEDCIDISGLSDGEKGNLLFEGNIRTDYEPYDEDYNPYDKDEADYEEDNCY